MSNNKQSSVEWLVKELNQKIDFIPMSKSPHNSFEGYYLWDEIKEVIEQAKAMHKEEIKTAHFEGQCDETEGYPLEIAKKFYNETYGGNK